MSYENPFGGIIAFIFAVVFLVVGAIARAVGADYFVVFSSFSYSCLAVLAAWVIQRWIGQSGYINLPIVSCALLAIIWPIWWKVLDSIAAGDSDKSSIFGSIFRHKETHEFLAAFDPPTVWYNSSLFEWGIELVLVASFVFGIRESKR